MGHNTRRLHRLFTVDGVYSLAGPGTVLTPGPPDSLLPAIGSRLELRRPDGTVCLASIHSIQLPTPNPRKSYPIGLGSSIVPGDVPLGTEVWLVLESAKATRHDGTISKPAV